MSLPILVCSADSQPSLQGPLGREKYSSPMAPAPSKALARAQPLQASLPLFGLPLFKSLATVFQKPNCKGEDPSFCD